MAAELQEIKESEGSERQGPVPICKFAIVKQYILAQPQPMTLILTKKMIYTFSNEKLKSAQWLDSLQGIVKSSMSGEMLLVMKAKDLRFHFESQD